ncbi:YwaF family protein [Virgibacillus salexigens]|uniref:YwaF family protein n=1 Tax=Virgibacillus salexigens TaxID=61016 RepID=UPI00190A4D2E|nr:TIGR02206 family membrane protein [Virgibacillus salexigens]
MHTPPFNQFGISHVIILVIYIVAFVLIIALSHHQHTQKFFVQLTHWLLFTILILSEISYQWWTLTTGIWNLQEHIPLHLCGIASITGAIALATKSQKLSYITFYIGFIPALLALITPELPYDFPHFRYWKFFIHHMAISLTSIFLLLFIVQSITFRSVLETYGYLLAYAIFIGFIINPLFQSNYLYLSSTPTAKTPLDLLGDGWLYYLSLCILAFLVFVVCYMVIYRRIIIRNH